MDGLDDDDRAVLARRTAVIAAWLNQVVQREVLPTRAGRSGVAPVLPLIDLQKAEACYERTLECTIQTEHYVRMTNEYVAEAKRIRSQLETVGLQRQHLSVAGQRSLASLTESARALGTQRASVGVLTAALMKATAAHHEVAVGVARAAGAKQVLQARTVPAEALEKELESLVPSLREVELSGPSIEQQMKQLSDVEGVYESYQRKAAARAEALAAKVPPEYTYEQLSGLAKQITELDTELQAYRAELAAYSDLAPDYAAAQRQVAAVRAEYQSLCEQFDAAVTEDYM